MKIFRSSLVTSLILATAVYGCGSHEGIDEPGAAGTADMSHAGAAGALSGSGSGGAAGTSNAGGGDLAGGAAEAGLFGQCRARLFGSGPNRWHAD